MPDHDPTRPVELPIMLQARIPAGLLLLYLSLIVSGGAIAANDRYMELALLAVIAGAVGLLQHFPGLTKLVLDHDGFNLKSIFGSKSVAWRDITNIRPTTKRRLDLVTWDYADASAQAPAALRQVVAHWIGQDSAQLAALMERVRRQALV